MDLIKNQQFNSTNYVSNCQYNQYYQHSISHNHQSKLSNATMISSERRGLYSAILCFRAETWPIKSLRLVLHYPFPPHALVSFGSRAFLSYFFSSSIKVFFISVRKLPQNWFHSAVFRSHCFRMVGLPKISTQQPTYMSQQSMTCPCFFFSPEQISLT